MSASQGSNEITIDAPVSEVWEVLQNSSLMPNWLSMVKRVEITSERKVGPEETRKCAVKFRGKSGYIVERCIEFVHGKHLSYSVDEDSLGFNRLFSDYKFSYTTTPQTPTVTLCRMELFCEPRNFFSRIINVLMKYEFSKTRQHILNSLKAYVEGIRKD